MLLTTNDAARLIGVSPSAVRGYERDGLLCATRTASGMRFFKEADVRRVAEARAQRQRVKNTPVSEP